jgi:hypothetical protein
MRKTIAILSLLATSLMSYGASAQPEGAPPAAPPPEGAAPAAAAPEAAPAPAPAPAPVAGEDKKIDVGLNLLPMLMGKMKTDAGSGDLKFAYGFGLSANYQVIPGLSVGIAPQFILNVKNDAAGAKASKELDLFARIAYTYKVMPGLGVYGELLPGYSLVMLPSEYKDAGAKNPKGLVLAFGAGATYDINEQIFLNVGVGYQLGMQKSDGNKANIRFLRIAVGAGMRF